MGSKWSSCWYIHALASCNENFGPPSKIGPPGLILAAKSGPPLPISVPPACEITISKQIRYG